MLETMSLMKWPLAACLVLPWLMVYLGLHIVQRQVIFVDLAIAQVSALGACLALLLGYDVHEWQSYVFSLGFTLAGGVLLAFTRSPNPRVPQEALIGIIYVMAAAAGILLLNFSPHGKEELQRSLVGELLFVKPSELLQTLLLFAVVGFIHYRYRRQFLAISTDPAAAAAEGISVRFWDFLFYILFALVVMSFVHIAGVLVAFSFLIVPAVCSGYLAESFTARFFVGWGIATFGGIGSLLLTARFDDLPIGATLVCGLGLCLLIVIIASALMRLKR